MPNFFSNVVGNFNVVAVQIDIIGHQRHSGTYGGHAGGGMNFFGAKVGFPFRLFYFFSHALKLAFANVGQILSCGSAG